VLKGEGEEQKKEEAAAVVEAEEGHERK